MLGEDLRRLVAATAVLPVFLAGLAGCRGGEAVSRAPAPAGAATSPTTSGSPTTAPPTPAATPAPTPVPTPAPTPSPVPVVQAGDGELAVVPGTSAIAGTGPRTSYVVEVEGGLGLDPLAVARQVERILADPRSWGAGGRRALQRVERGDVAFRVALASPDTTDRLCLPLDTGGYFSCANGERAVLNAARWLTGAPTYEGELEAYRTYLLNHEVGHTLGFGHVRCPGPAQPAPVMVQQSKSLQGCAQNPWPYPEG